MLSSTARQIQELIAEIPGITNVGIRRDQEQPEFVLKVNRQRAADLGLVHAANCQRSPDSDAGQGSDADPDRR